MTYPRHALSHLELGRLLAALSAQDFRLIGPHQRDGAITYAEITGVTDLPAGWTDEQAPGHYRLNRREDQALFAYAVGPHSWKQELFPARQPVWRAQQQGDDFTIELEEVLREKRAFIGVRACELAAMAIQDRVFTGGIAVDSAYAARRQDVFIVAVHCTHPAATCFCTSMNSGPRCAHGFDIALTELIEDGVPRYVLEVGSPAGQDLIAPLQLAPAAAESVQSADTAIAGAAARISRSLDTDGIKELLYTNAEHPRWDAIAERCVSCGNCTMVCPTCFCSSVEDTTSLDGLSAERTRQWASCFDPEFTHLAGAGPSRSSTPSRYRHWLTHKLASWQDQFGSSGCVGCGRCITWCPPGIDLTEEVHAIRVTVPRDTRGNTDV